MVRSLTHVKVPEPDLLQNARDNRQRRTAEELAAKVRNREVASAVDACPESEVLMLDEQTFRDLEIFAAENAGGSLFDYCNHTRNAKGARVLRARMRRPFSSPQRIRAVQDSLAFMLTHSAAFDALPSFVTTDLVEEYIHGILPLVMSGNSVEFIIGVLDIRYGDDLRYNRILRGVEASSALIRSLREVLARLDSASPQGEVAGLLDELRTLVERPGFEAITERRTWDMRPWTVLRMDQLFRLHEKHTLYRLLQLVYELDALLAMALTTRQHGLVMPVLEQGPLAAHGEAVVHPLVEAPVANPVSLDQQCRLLFLTGPNMAGKTTYLRASAIALYLAHLGMGVPARSFSFVPAQRLFSSITLADNLSIGVSYFRAEALRVKAIAEALAQGYRTIAIMDEPFKGTNVKDALDASLQVLLRFAEREGSLFMFSSHLIEMEQSMRDHSQVDCRHFEAEENAGPLRFDYRLRPGVSGQRLGMRVLQEEGIFKLLDGTGGQSEQQ